MSETTEQRLARFNEMYEMAFGSNDIPKNLLGRNSLETQVYAILELANELQARLKVAEEALDRSNRHFLNPLAVTPYELDTLGKVTTPDERAAA